MNDQERANELVTNWMLAESIIQGLDLFGVLDDRDRVELEKAKRVVAESQQALQALGYAWIRRATERPTLICKREEVAA